METSFYSFQLSRLACLATRSRRTDIDLVTFGVLLNKREQGRGAAVTPMFNRTTLRGKEITDYALSSGHWFSSVNMGKDWTIGPIEVRPDDTVDVALTVTNTGDSSSYSAHQEKVDQWTINVLNIYYSWLLGQFVSGLGLKALAKHVGGSAVSAVAGFFADPVGKLLGYELSGPCNGLVLADALDFTARELDSLDYTPEQVKPGRPVPEKAVVTRSYAGTEGHSEERCGEVARTEVDVTVRRYTYWSLKQHLWESGGSMRRRYPKGGGLKELAGVRL